MRGEVALEGGGGEFGDDAGVLDEGWCGVEEVLVGDVCVTICMWTVSRTSRKRKKRKVELREGEGGRRKDGYDGRKGERKGK